MNRRRAAAALAACAAAALPTPPVRAQAPRLDDLVKQAGKRAQDAAVPSSERTPDERTRAAGIREALAVGTENAVRGLARRDGYFANAAVKILLPSSLQKAADLARAAGLGKPVDEFVLSINRAAEAAVPRAAPIFGDAIRALTFDDARAILSGGPTAATEFFRRKTHDRLHDAFKPVVAGKVREVGATRAWEDLGARLQKIPFAGTQRLDLDEYVTARALEGLYTMVGEEEKKIRANPLARTTDLLKAVFGR